MKLFASLVYVYIALARSERGEIVVRLAIIRMTNDRDGESVIR